MAAGDHDWTTPAAVAIPAEGYFELERGRYGPIYPRTPACYGFSIIAKVKEGREEAVRAYGKQIEEAIKGSPDVLAPLRHPRIRHRPPCRQVFGYGAGWGQGHAPVYDYPAGRLREPALSGDAGRHRA
jgi:hypothetical protein